jgi:hypothetical protein
VVETAFVLSVVSKGVGVYEDGEDTVTGVGRKRLIESTRTREREREVLEERERLSGGGGIVIRRCANDGVFSRIADMRKERERRGYEM